MLHWCNISRIVIKSVTRPGAAGFVHCPPITCPLPPIWEIGSFSPSPAGADKTRPSQDASYCGAGSYSKGLCHLLIDLST